MIADEGPRTDAHLATQPFVLGQRCDRPRHRRRIRCEESRPPDPDQLPVGRDVRGHNREAGRHRLDDGVRQALETGREHEDVRGGEVLGHIVPGDLAREDDPIADVGIGSQERLVIGVAVMVLAIAADRDRGEVRIEPEDFEEPFDPLDRNHLPDPGEERASFRESESATGFVLGREPLEPTEVEAVRDHQGSVLRETLGEGVRIDDEQTARQESRNRRMGQECWGESVSIPDLPRRLLPEEHDPRKRLCKIRSRQRVIRIQNLEQVVVVANRAQHAGQGQDATRVDQRTRDDHAGLLEHGAVQAGRIEAEQVDVNVGSEGLEELEGLQGQPAALPEMRHDEQDSDLEPSFEAQGGSLRDSDRRDDGNRFTNPSSDLTLGIHDFLLPLPRKIRSALRRIFFSPVLDRSDSLPTLEKHRPSTRRPDSLILNSNTKAPASSDSGPGSARYGLKYGSRVSTPGTLACGYSWSAPGTSPSVTPETRTSGSTSSEAWNGSAMRSGSFPSWSNIGPPALPRFIASLRSRCT